MAIDRKNIKTVRLKAPLSDHDIAGLEIGTVVFLDGIIYTAREAVYKHVIADGAPMPARLTSASNVNFHCSPAASLNSDGTYNIGGVTATASFRFAKWLPDWFKQSGCKVIIGKGGMSPKHYRDIFVPVGAIYLTTVGYGTGALLGRGIVRVVDTYGIDDFGIAQAGWTFEVENFGPLLVESDINGNSLFETHNADINSSIERAYEGLKPLALSRFGETDKKTDELI